MKSLVRSRYGKMAFLRLEEGLEDFQSDPDVWKCQRIDARLFELHLEKQGSHDVIKL